MPRQKTVMPRGKRPPRAAADNSSAINNVLLGKRNIRPALAAAVNLPGPSSAPAFTSMHPARRIKRPLPSGGIGVKNMEVFGKRNRDIKIKKVLPQSKVVQVKKNGVVVRTMTVRRETYFPEEERKFIN